MGLFTPGYTSRMAHTVKTLFLTDRSPHHQAAALAAAPPPLDVTMLRRPTRMQLLTALSDAEFLITERAGEIDRELIEAAPHLRLIQRLGSLTHDIDIAAASERGIPVCYRPIPACIMVAEHLMMQLLTLQKQTMSMHRVAIGAEDWGRPSQRTDENTFAYNWSGQQGIEGIGGETIGIMGFGEIGVEFARRLQPFRPARILYNKRTPLPENVEVSLNIDYAIPDTLFSESTVLCSLLPYSSQTDHYINSERLATLPTGARLISCGSGSVIDESAVANALKQGQLTGVALDTFEYEPLRQDNPLVQLAHERPDLNILLTPHIAAGASSRSSGDSGRAADYQNLLNYMTGKRLENQV